MVLKSIPINLQQEVLNDFFGKILDEQNVFKTNFSKEFLAKLVLKMSEIVFGPGEIVFNKGSNDKRLYFIKKGEIELFDKV